MTTAVPSPLKTVVEEYVEAALDRALTTELTDGVIEAHLDGFPQIRAYGDDRHECYQALSNTVLNWVRLWLSRGFRLPEFGGIDLNRDRDVILSTFRSGTTEEDEEKNEVYETEEELFAALDGGQGT